MPIIITIDGPTASGKSSIAQEIAKRFNFWYLNTGLLFRALAWGLLKKGYTQSTIVAPTQKDIESVLNHQNLSYRVHADGSAHTNVNGIDITHELKNPEIAQAASLVSTNGTVRTALVELERSIAQSQSCVVDGRDCGSVVFPHADIKFFLTAPLEERARRFADEQNQRGKQLSFEQAREEVQTRDERDSTRAIAPLCIPKGATIVDSDNMTLLETIDYIEKLIRSKLTSA